MKTKRITEYALYGLDDKTISLTELITELNILLQSEFFNNCKGVKAKSENNRRDRNKH